MKIAHLADLHLGKTLRHLSLIDDQKAMIETILDCLQHQQVDVVLIAGDVYDRYLPSSEATNLLSYFLNQLYQRDIQVIVIAGNHDSGSRLEYVSELLNQMNIHIIGNYKGEIKPITIPDTYGDVHFYPIPYLRPSVVNQYIDEEDQKVHSYDEAFAYVIKNLNYNPQERNILIAHQFVVGAQVDNNSSEELIVGGLDQISATYFESFDYVALGHIHRPQQILKETIRYAGTMLKYSFGEAKQNKSMPVLTLNEKGNYTLDLLPLIPQHDLLEVHMNYQDLLKKETIQQYQNAYLHVVLKDKQLIDDASHVLKYHYPYLLKVDYESIFTGSEDAELSLSKLQSKSPEELFQEFYSLRNGEEMSEEQVHYIQNLFLELHKGETV